MNLAEKAEKVTRGGFEVTPQQKEIIDHVAAHPVTVTAAGAGSGKTYTTVAAVLHLIETRGASIDQFVLISFTNKAANSLREKIQSAIHQRALGTKTDAERYFWRAQQERLAAAYVGTIHGFCRQILKLFAYPDQVAYNSDITFAIRLRDEVFRESILKHYQSRPAAALYGGQSQMADYELLRLMGSLYEHVRNQGYQFKEISSWTRQQEEDSGKPYRVAMAELMEEAAAAYDKRKKQEQMLDTHDLLQKTSDLLTADLERDMLARQIARRYRYLFVDEFQDTDAVQKNIVEALVPYLQAVLVVGDQKQSIYAFRGTQVKLLEELSYQYMKKPPLPMNISRRPTDRFRKVVNKLFEMIARHPNYRFLKEPLEAYNEILKGEGDPPPLIFLKTDEASGRGGRIKKTAEAIRKILSGKYTLEHKQGKLSPIQQADIVILTRTNYVLREYVEGLRKEFAGSGIEVRPDIGEAFYSLPEIVSVTYMLQLLLAYPKDDAALTLALDSPFLRLVNRRQAVDEKVRQVQKPVSGSPISEAFMYDNTHLHQNLLQLQKMMRVATVPQLLEQLYRLFNIREYYGMQQDEQAIQNLEYLREVARNLFSQDQALTLHTFVDFLRTSKLSGREEEIISPPKRNEELEERKSPPYIRVMTIHRAKGLEFPIVVLPEIHAPLIRSGEEQAPPFLIVNYEDSAGNKIQHGLEVKLKIKSEEEGEYLDTRSPQYRQGMQLDQEKLRPEEMRVLYVALTRAEHTVVLIGKERKNTLPPNHPQYSWQDEILRAKQELENLGAVFGK